MKILIKTICFYVFLAFFVGFGVNCMDRSKSAINDPDDGEATILKRIFKNMSKKEFDEITRSASIPNFKKIKSKKSGLKTESESYEIDLMHSFD
ncbi:hypothetical protein KJ644_04125 [Candidatus Dependentiae bacterium]|nr:hypothetical protein [Candidatus Dependentiae bacterium]MBU4387633.1 hypothetical protein [Candidatus Dependentiae bacterium]MCG2756454.1 hypothetical protein [Candidatus Dependentiae bacterium]